MVPGLPRDFLKIISAVAATTKQDKHNRIMPTMKARLVPKEIRQI